MDLELDVRIELGLLDQSSVCTFTSRLAFLAYPAKGDFIVLEFREQLIIKVSGLCHFVKDRPALLILTEAVICNNYDDLLKYLDWFKASFTISDIRSDTPPHSYYVFYRTLLNLLGVSKEIDPKISNDPIDMKVLAEVCRSIIAAEVNGKNINCDLNDMIKLLYDDIIYLRREYKDNIPIIAVIKLWESRINRNGQFKWDKSDSDYHVEMRKAFGKLRSIPEARLPRMV